MLFCDKNLGPFIIDGVLGMSNTPSIYISLAVLYKNL